MRRLSGFSLMEMMTVLLIVSIIAAASAPMINKKMMLKNVAGNANSPWTRVNNAGSIAFNMAGDNNIFAAVGTNAYPEDKNIPRFYINSADPSTNPHLILAKGNTNLLKVLADNNSVVLSDTNSVISDSVMIGYGASVQNGSGVSIGRNVTTDRDSVAIGTSSQTGNASVAIGSGVNVSENGSSLPGKSVHIGYGSFASLNSSMTTDTHAVAVGAETVSAGHSVAVGATAKADGDAIAIGSAASADFGGVAIGGGDATSSGTYADDDFNAAKAGTNSVAIGYQTNAVQYNSIAIGMGAKTNNESSLQGDSAIAIGKGATASAGSTIVLGIGSSASADGAITIGNGIENSQANTIMLGGDGNKVVVEGNIDVKGTTRLKGDVYINDYKLEIKDLFTSGNYHYLYGPQNYSDRRMKNVGEAFTGGLAELKKLDLFHFTYKKDKSKTPHVGVMAQDLQKVFPDAVSKGDDGFLRIRLEDMFYALINSVKELDKRFEELKQQEILTLKNKVDKLEKENKELVKQNKDFEKRLSDLEKKMK